MADFSAKSEKKPELLAPAGSLAALRAAISAGADAVYLGGTEFSARANAKNFSREELKYAIALARDHGVKTNITANTLVFDRELDEWLRYGEFLWEAGADAMIVADLGAAAEMHRRIPEFALHASTQAGICDVGGARLAAELGFSRVVLSRELCRDDIKKITDECGVETEMFIHGALCVSVSGQCLFSSVVGQRSGNRGECAQPCRMQYGEGYPLSLRDNCLAAHIPDILSLGVSSLKIEGRMKSPEYVFGVTEMYRRLIDENRAATKDEINRLKALFSRSGFTDAYFTGADRGDMLGVRTDSDKRESSRLSYVQKPLREPKLDFPVRKLPETAGGELTFPREARTDKKGKELVLSFISAEQQQKSGAKADARQSVVLPIEQFLKDGHSANIAELPPVFFESEADAVRELAKKAKDKGAEMLACSSLGGVKIARDMEMPFICTHRCQTANSLTALLYKRLGAKFSVVSPELSAPAVRDINKAAASCCFAYGKLPLMTLTRCIIKEKLGCNNCKKDRTKRKLLLTDRMGVKFPVFSLYGCRNVIYNSLPTYIGARDTEKCGCSLFWLDFTDEDGASVPEVIKSLVLSRELDISVRRIGTQKAGNERNSNGKNIRNRYGKLEHSDICKGKRNTSKRAVRGGGR